MSRIVIKVENISKLYRLGQIGTGTLTHDLKRMWAKYRGKEDPYQKIGTVNDRSKKADSDYVWALNDISFEIGDGDILGIVGKNGSGKSTLLKILSRITSPTTGNIKIKGSVASLLEVGTGFHAEMTGRENIYMNGAILGMTKKEISSKFDEIVDFAGVQMYVDTPVKRYSSGMYVRLAFAVAAHLDTDILIIDEVLAVGDADFQKKCLSKMSDVSKNQGKTVLFVSHNIYAVSEICNIGIMLENGILAYKGNIADTLTKYIANKHGGTEVYVTSNKEFLFNGIQNLNVLNDLSPNSDIHFLLSFTSRNIYLVNTMIDFNLYNENNENVVHSRSNWLEFKFDIKPNSNYLIEYKVKSPKLSPGKYFLTVYLYHGTGFPILHIDNIEACTINAKNYFGKSLYLDNVISNTVPEFEIKLGSE